MSRRSDNIMFYDELLVIACWQPQDMSCRSDNTMFYNGLLVIACRQPQDMSHRSDNIMFYYGLLVIACWQPELVSCRADNMFIMDFQSQTAGNHSRCRAAFTATWTPTTQLMVQVSSSAVINCQVHQAEVKQETPSSDVCRMAVGTLAVYVAKVKQYLFIGAGITCFSSKVYFKILHVISCLSGFFLWEILQSLLYCYCLSLNE